MESISQENLQDTISFTRPDFHERISRYRDLARGVYYLNARTNQRTMMEDRLPRKLMNNLRFRILETEPLIF